MKRVLLILILFSAYFSKAQNYQCLQSGVKHYFTNGNGYLRGIRIDSVKTSGSDVIYYPFHTSRGRYPYAAGFNALLDSNGGSWLGKKVIQRNNGTFLFDNLWGDTVIINTQASIGDTWVFCKDTSSLYYYANVLSIDTMTVLGVLDTVKTIIINAYNGTTLITADPVNNFQIVLSKNHGFVHTFDLYTFPYHAPDSNYARGFDYYLDALIHNSTAPFIPTQSNSTFALVQLTNPTGSQLYDWNVGDVFEYSVCN
ncbi:MAG: hypothetical protein ACHQD8_04595, partial [Chitinophagales bacterium]